MIRDAAMTLFAERGTADVTIREIAGAAGVSPGLVMHHFGSKERLKAALDARAAAFMDEMATELIRIQDEGGVASLIELLIARLERERALAGYVGRLLLDDSGAGDRLFGTLLQTTGSVLEKLRASGFVHDAPEEQTRAAFLLVNDLALILLRRRIETALGFDPLSREGLARWSRTVMDVYSRGVFATVADCSAPPEQAR